MDKLTANGNIDKKRYWTFNLFFMGGLFKTILFWFLLIALIPVIVDRYFNFVHTSYLSCRSLWNELQALSGAWLRMDVPLGILDYHSFGYCRNGSFL